MTRCFVKAALKITIAILQRDCLSEGQKSNSQKNNFKPLFLSTGLLF